MKFLVLSLFVLPMMAQAALTPTAESLRRLRAVTESPEVYSAFGGFQWVKSITDNGNGNYTVASKECALTAKVEAVISDEPEMVPPLKVTIGKLNCLPK